MSPCPQLERTFWRRGRVAAALAIVAVVTACDETRGTSELDGAVHAPDAGPPPFAEPAAVVPPSAPELPMPTCRAGWRLATHDSDMPYCEPFPEPRPTCADDEVLFPGGERCERIGNPCESDWPTDLPDAHVLYVRAGAPASGTGSRDAPFATVDSAIRAAQRGDTIALARGTYGPFDATKAVSIVGACTAETIITATDTREDFGVVEIGAGPMRLANVTVRGGRRQGIAIDGRFDATLEHVQIEDTVLAGLAVYGGARVTARDVRVRRIAAGADGTGGRGVNVQEATLTLERAVLEDLRDTAITILTATATLTDVLISRVTLSRDGFGGGVELVFDSTLHADGLVVEDAATYGVLSHVNHPVISLANLVVRRSGRDGVQIGEGTTGSVASLASLDNGRIGLMLDAASVEIDGYVAAGNTGSGIQLRPGSELSLRHARIGGNGGTALLVAGGTQIARAHVTDAQLTRNGGRAVQAQSGGDVTLSRVAIAENDGTQVVVRDEGTSLTARDCVVSDPVRHPELSAQLDQARGIEVRLGARATLDRFQISGAGQVGLLVELATLDAHDLHVRDTRFRDDEMGDGYGVAFADARGILERVALERTAGCALLVDGAASVVSVTDLVARDTRGSGVLRLTGKGLVATRGAELTVDRAELVGNREVGVAAFSAGTRLAGRRVVVRDTHERECVSTTCAGYGGGIGIGAYAGASATFTDFVSDSAALAGLQVDATSTMELADGVISNQPIGVNYEGDPSQFDRLTQRVRFLRNVRNVAADALPVPELAIPPVTPEP